MAITPADHRTPRAAPAWAPPTPSAATPPDTLDLLRCLVHALDQQGEGLAIVTHEALLIYANPVARRILRAHGWLQREPQVRPGSVGAQEAWLRALHAACTAQSRSLVELGSAPAQADEESLGFVAVAPLHIDGLRCASLSFSRAQTCGPLELTLFAKHCRLSASERDVLQLFCRGEKPAAIAAMCGVALSTITTHLKAIRAKTGCTDLRDLLHTVARLPSLRTQAVYESQGAH